MKDYEAYLNGDDSRVEVIEVSILVVKEFDARSIKDLRKQIDVTQTGLADETKKIEGEE